MDVFDPGWLHPAIPTGPDTKSFGIDMMDSVEASGGSARELSRMRAIQQGQ